MVALLIKISSILLLAVTSTGIILNTLLLFIIFRYTKRSVGFYKYLMTLFCFYELLFGVILLFVMPLHFVSHRTWIVFSFNGILPSSLLATNITSFYCMLYASWLGFVLVNYLYRYMALCRHGWLHFIAKRIWLKMLLSLLFFIFFFGTAFCAYYSCRVHFPRQDSLDYIRDNFHLEPVNLSYIMVTIQDPVSEKVEASGIVAIIVHLVFLIVWLSIITYCSVKMFQRIKFLQQVNEGIRENIGLEKQLFFTLFLQTIIPLVFCGIPSIIHFTFPFWPQAAFFSPLSPTFSTISSLPKMLDPLVSLLFIKTYRRALQRMLHMDISTSTEDHQSHANQAGTTHYDPR